MGKKRMQKTRSLVATLHDGKEINIAVYKAGKEVELRFYHPDSGNPITVLVHPLNRGTVDGWMHEIEVQCGLRFSVASWR
ncbi:hypothetical protein ES703_12468 [subsurface metagenome]